MDLATLRVEQPAPQFVLSSANRDGDFSLSSAIARGPVILEFLRGTW
jgi:peroxiredoxin